MTGAQGGGSREGDRTLPLPLVEITAHSGREESKKGTVL